MKSLLIGALAESDIGALAALRGAMTPPHPPALRGEGVSVGFLTGVEEMWSGSWSGRSAGMGSSSPRKPQQGLGDPRTFTATRPPTPQTVNVFRRVVSEFVVSEGR